MELKPLFKRFLDSYSNPNTRTTYLKNINPFLEWLKSKSILEVEHLQMDFFNEYSQELHKGNNRLLSIKNKLHCIYLFYKFLFQLDYIGESYLKFLAIPKRAPVRKTPGLSDLEALGFLNADYSGLESKFVRVRDRLIFHIFLYLGLRIEEVFNLDLADISLNKVGVSYIFIKGKGGSGEYMALKKSLIPLILKYLKLRAKRDIEGIEKGFLITSKGKLKRLSLIQIRWLIKDRVKRFGFKKKITAHWFRVTAISHLSEKAGIRSACYFARHKNINTTLGYDRRRINLKNHPSFLIDYKK